MRNIILFLFVILCFHVLQAQDTLFRTNGTVLLVKISDILNKEIKYVDKTDSLNPVSYFISKDLVEKIYISDSNKYIFIDKNIPLIKKPVKTDREWMLQGTKDAGLFYHGYGTAACITGGAAAYLPLFGLVAALSTATVAPRIKNLGIPDPEYAKNPYYVMGYTQQARKIKNRRIWTSFGIGTGTFIGLLVLLNASGR